MSRAGEEENSLLEACWTSGTYWKIFPKELEFLNFFKFFKKNQKILKKLTFLVEMELEELLEKNYFPAMLQTSEWF